MLRPQRLTPPLPRPGDHAARASNNVGKHRAWSPRQKTRAASSVTPPPPSPPVLPPLPTCNEPPLIVVVPTWSLEFVRASTPEANLVQARTHSVVAYYAGIDRVETIGPNQQRDRRSRCIVEDEITETAEATEGCRS